MLLGRVRINAGIEELCLFSVFTQFFQSKPLNHEILCMSM